MPFVPATPFPKEKGQPLRSSDWNQLVTETQRLDTDKVNKNLADSMKGPLTIEGGLGLGVALPKAALHIAGGQWDVTNSEGDLRIGSDTLRLKIGVATGGGGAGDVRIRAQGGTNRLILGSNTDDLVTLQNGSMTVNAALNIVPSQSVSFGSQVRQMINLWSTEYGIGVQGGTQYFRTNSNFAWFRGGSHSDGAVTPGAGGVLQMCLRNDRLGIGTDNPAATLDVNGAIRAGGSDIYFTQTNHTHTGLGNSVGFAAIENASSHDALMILGRTVSRSPLPLKRVVSLWDELNVNGDLNITQTCSFGAQVRQMINLWNADYGIGVQGGTQYFRSGSDFAWFRGGSHNDATQNPGGGVRLMAVNGSGDLILSARTNPTNAPSGSACRALVDSGNSLTINFQGDYSGGVNIFNGRFVSSRTVKDNIVNLSREEAMKAFAKLIPVTFRYKTEDTDVRHAGFIAEDVPDLVASPDHGSIGALDIVALLTKVVQEQQSLITGLSDKLNHLETKLQQAGVVEA